MNVVKLDTRHITDWDSFHEVFAKELGFPNFYGRNRNAWIDCMTALDDPSVGMTSLHGSLESVLALQLEFVDDFTRRRPEQYAALVECTAFVNWRRMELGESPVLTLSFNKHA